MDHHVIVATLLQGNVGVVDRNRCLNVRTLTCVEVMAPLGYSLEYVLREELSLYSVHILLTNVLYANLDNMPLYV